MVIHTWEAGSHTCEDNGTERGRVGRVSERDRRHRAVAAITAERTSML